MTHYKVRGNGLKKLWWTMLVTRESTFTRKMIMTSIGNGEHFSVLGFFVDFVTACHIHNYILWFSGKSSWRKQKPLILLVPILYFIANILIRIWFNYRDLYHITIPFWPYQWLPSAVECSTIGDGSLWKNAWIHEVNINIHLGTSSFHCNFKFIYINTFWISSFKKLNIHYKA